MINIKTQSIQLHYMIARKNDLPFDTHLEKQLRVTNAG